jgi:hypothetical protein
MSRGLLGVRTKDKTQLQYERKSDPDESAKRRAQI